MSPFFSAWASRTLKISSCLRSVRAPTRPRVRAIVVSSAIVFSVSSARFIRPSRGGSLTGSRATAFVSPLFFASLVASLAASGVWRCDGITVSLASSLFYPRGRQRPGALSPRVGSSHGHGHHRTSGIGHARPRPCTGGGNVLTVCVYYPIQGISRGRTGQLENGGGICLGMLRRCFHIGVFATNTRNLPEPCQV